jgi:hypothetical protein
MYISYVDLLFKFVRHFIFHWQSIFSSVTRFGNLSLLWRLFEVTGNIFSIDFGDFFGNLFNLKKFQHLTLLGL